MFGADALALSQILVNSIQQLTELRQIMRASSDELKLLQDLNQGIQDSMDVLRLVSPMTDPGTYGDWSRVSDALNGIQGIYGKVVPSQNERVQRDADQSVAEAATLNHSVYAYSEEVDQVGDRIQAQSHAVSPAGAERLSARSSGAMLQVMGQSLRVQATGLKLQAQTLAIQNQKEKEATKQILDTSGALSSAMKTRPPKFGMPRF